MQHQPPRDQDCNGCRKDQRHPPPQLPLPSLDSGFKSVRSLLLTASSMSSISDRLEGSWHSQHGRQCRQVRTHVKINLPVFKDADAKECSNLPKLEVGFDSIPACGVQGSHPPTICHPVFAGFYWWVSTELWYGYNFGQCVDNLRWKL